MNILVRARALAVLVCAMGVVGTQTSQAVESGFYAALSSDAPSDIQKRTIESPRSGQVLEPIAGWSAEFADDLLQQALLLQDQGNVERSQEFLMRAAETYRISLGPHSQQQLLALVPMLDQFLQKNDWAALSNTLAAVMRIYAYHYEPTHPVYIQVNRERAHWHLQAFTSGQSDSRLAELEAAYKLYGDAIKLSSAYYGNADPQLPELLYNLASVAYLFADSYLTNDDGAPPVITRPGTRLANNWNPERAAFGYMQGRRALEGIVSLHSSKPENQGALVEARFALADWHEAFGYYKRAEEERKHAVGLSATLSPEEYNNRVTSRSPSPWQVSARELVTDVSLSMK